MFKKTVMSLGLVTVFTFISCGGGSSKEAKEILKKILTVMGIPPKNITNICQTSNSSDVCEGLKLHKLENSKNKTWQKIKETGVGQYLLETTNPCEPILLELTDDDVDYDSGEFFLKFSGVEMGETTKELSILEAMVDASYLSASSVSSIKTLNSSDAQNKFYATLYGDLKKNINTLRTAGLTKTQSIRGTLKEMAEELKEYGVDSTLPTKINACGDDMGCVDGELTELSSKLLIYASETDAIVEAQKDNNAPLSVKEVSCEENNKILYKEDFTNNPNFTSLSNIGKANWNKENGYYIVETRDDLNDKYWAYSPNIGNINPQEKDIKIKLDLLIEKQNWGTYPNIGFYKNIPNEINEESRVFHIFNFNANNDRERIAIYTKDEHLKTPEWSISDNIWYSIEIETKAKGTKANIKVINKSNNFIISDFTNVNFSISTFNYIGIGYYNKADYGSDWVLIKVDNILIEEH